MDNQDFTRELEYIQAEFSSGLSALAVVQEALDENPGPEAAEALHVAYIFLQGIYDKLSSVSSRTSAGDKTG